MTPFVTRTAFALLVTLPAAAPAQDWCDDGSRLSPTESAICDDIILSRLEREMTTLYTAPGAGRAGISLSQRTWLDRRDACGSDVVCIEMAYRDRIRELTPSGSLPMAVLPPRPGDEEAISRPGDEEVISRPAPTASPSSGPLRPWCDGAQNPTERTICDTPRLADMDAALGAVYGAAKASDGDAAQMAWLRENRDACGTDRLCIARAYVERIVQLGARLRAN